MYAACCHIKVPTTSLPLSLVILNMNQIEIYQTKDKQTQVEVSFQEETVWLTQKQITTLFCKDRTVITKHIRNIFKERELEEKVVCAKFAHTTTVIV